MSLEFNRKEILRTFRPLWDDPEKQGSAMKLERLLKERRWEQGARKWRASRNPERSLEMRPLRPSWQDKPRPCLGLFKQGPLETREQFAERIFKESNLALARLQHNSQKVESQPKTLTPKAGVKSLAVSVHVS